MNTKTKSALRSTLEQESAALEARLPEPEVTLAAASVEAAPAAVVVEAPAVEAPAVAVEPVAAPAVKAAPRVAKAAPKAAPKAAKAPAKSPSDARISARTASNGMESAPYSSSVEGGVRGIQNRIAGSGEFLVRLVITPQALQHKRFDNGMPRVIGRGGKLLVDLIEQGQHLLVVAPLESIPQRAGDLVCSIDRSGRGGRYLCGVVSQNIIQ